MRIFVHPSLGPERHVVEQRVTMLSIPRPYADANWELDYLCDARTAREHLTADESDLELFEAVASMKDPKATVKIRRHYIETHKALNKMRQAHSRELLSLRRLKSTFS